ncbi:hypothetical protein J8273_1206 [Carpediemonas membranifera]|uniref:Uncharacterized protein n=1 Tax=Carpediemonas membranifera TaxID=201153 RepID=A0A8J6AXI2_9EUKA|nr:hypothetical protein J8273_1206 [Carpediemonas membranifera]|eukprot:KAG9397291.1 hypothetical protein J8273_1206 [Carpediemonas membranifera]
MGSQEYELKEYDELFIKVPNNGTADLMLVTGSAYVFGAELVRNKTYRLGFGLHNLFSGHNTTKVKVTTVGPAKVERSQQSGAVLSQGLTRFLQESIGAPRHHIDPQTQEPRSTPCFVVTGGTRDGKGQVGRTGLCRSVINNVARINPGKTIMYVSLDPSGDGLGVPGCIGAAELIQGWPVDGLRVQTPICHFVGRTKEIGEYESRGTQADRSIKHYDNCLEKLTAAVRERVRQPSSTVCCVVVDDQRCHPPKLTTKQGAAGPDAEYAALAEPSHHLMKVIRLFNQDTCHVSHCVALWDLSDYGMGNPIRYRRFFAQHQGAVSAANAPARNIQWHFKLPVLQKHISAIVRELNLAETNPVDRIMDAYLNGPHALRVPEGDRARYVGPTTPIPRARTVTVPLSRVVMVQPQTMHRTASEWSTVVGAVDGRVTAYTMDIAHLSTEHLQHHVVAVSHEPIPEGEGQDAEASADVSLSRPVRLVGWVADVLDKAKEADSITKLVLTMRGEVGRDKLYLLVSDNSFKCQPYSGL